MRCFASSVRASRRPWVALSRSPIAASVLAALLIAACGDDEQPASGAAAGAAPQAADDAAAAAAAQADSTDPRDRWTATVTLDGETLQFKGQQCLGAADNFAFIGFAPDSDDSFEIQAAPNGARQEVRLFVGDTSYLAGDITDIEVGDWHAAGSARFSKEGAEIDFDVSCK